MSFLGAIHGIPAGLPTMLGLRFTRVRTATQAARPARVICLLLGSIALVSCGTGTRGFHRTQVTASQVVPAPEFSASTSMASTVPDLYVTGPQIKEKMLKLIAEASDYILIDSFIVRADPATMEVMEALKSKHRSGVRIYLLADSCSRFMKGGEVGYNYLRDAEIPNAEYNPFRPHRFVLPPVLLPRDHRKFWIVDGRVLFLGGANIYSESLIPSEQGGNVDFMVAVESAEAIERMIGSFVATWNESSRQQLNEGSFQVRAPQSAETRLWLFDHNRDLGHQRDLMAEMFKGLFALAKEQVWLIHAYTFTTPELLSQIRDLTSRGVEVNLMLAGRVHAPRYHYGSFYGIKDVLEAGGKVWIFDGEQGALHSKGVVVDGRWASVGSANLNRRSSYGLSSEANMLFDDRQSVGKVVRNLEDLKKHCRPVGIQESKSYRGPVYYLTWRVMQLLG